MEYKIAIIGAGQLGSRYLQGLSKVTLEIEIFVVDVSLNSLNLAKKRWEEVRNDKITVNYTTDINSLPQHINLAIISTSSDSRIFVSRQLIKNRVIQFVILEKVLAQSPNEINELRSIYLNKSITWVNTFLRTVDHFKNLKSNSVIGPIKVYVKGGNWGIACNTIHILDLITWWTGEQILSFDTTHLDKKWKKSKREKFWDLNGRLIVSFTNGSIANLISEDSNSDFIIEIKTNQHKWLINWNQDEKKGIIPLQSYRTPLLVENILINGKCGLQP